jgi:hypothetical protein
MKIESHSGVVLSLDALKETAKGTCTEFTFLAKDRTIPCFVWNDVTEKYGPYLTPKSQLVIRGIRDLSHALKITSYQVLQLKGLPHKGFDKDGWASEIRARERAGQSLIFAPGTKNPCFERSTHLVRHGNTIKRKIDFVMDVLGAQLVEHRIRQVCPNYQTFDNGEYKRLLETMVTEAKDFVSRTEGVSWL